MVLFYVQNHGLWPPRPAESEDSLVTAQIKRDAARIAAYLVKYGTEAADHWEKGEKPKLPSSSKR